MIWTRRGKRGARRERPPQPVKTTPLRNLPAEQSDHPSSSAIDALIHFFPTGTTEGEQHILRQAFVRTEEYGDLMTPPPLSPRLLVGKKGSGKSAVIDFSLSVLGAGQVPALLLKPLDIELGIIGKGASVGEITRTAYDALLKAIAAKLGSELGGLLNGDGKRLYDEAVRAGLRDRDSIEKIAAVLPKLAKPWTATDLSVVLPQETPAVRMQLERAIRQNLEESESGIYLFIDDTDQVAAPDHPGDINRIWAVLLAARELTRRNKKLRCVVSLREEVWRRLTTHEAGQRDQTDHFSPLVHRLNPTRAHIRAIVHRRLKLAAARARGTDDVDPFGLFFDGVVARMPSSEEPSSWSDLVVNRSRDRPRDAIQLVNALAKHAKERNVPKIYEKDLHEVMPKFSEERVNFLAQEIEAECTQIRDVIRSVARMTFDYGPFKITTESLRKEFRTVPSEFSLTVRGQKLQPDSDADALTLLGLLFDLGVINARVADSREKDGYRHVFPDEDPTLVSKARWNDLQAVIWEVNPVYRDFMIKVQREYEAKTGLPPRRPPRRVRP